VGEYKKKYPQLHIQLLEPRIMFDGAAIYAASEAIDLLNEQNSSSSNESSLSSDLNPVIENLNSTKEIVFIDSGVEDYQTIVNAIDSSKSIYLIDANENGFLKMQNVLRDQSDIDAVHIIGHASAGQVVLGNSILNADTINSFSTALQSIGNSLAPEGDLLFYGCNLAQGEQGKLLLQQIGNITQADIAASDDITGQGGDWELEHNHGIVETKGIEVIDYKSFLLQEGISSLSGFVENTGTNLRAGTSDAGTASSASNHTDGNKPFVITYERTVTSGSFTFYNNTSTSTGFEENDNGVQTAGPTITSNTTTVNASSTPMNVYYVYATENSGRNDVRSVTFDGEIKGVWFNMNNIVSYSGVSKSGATYHNDSQHGSGSQNAYSTEKLKWNWGTNITVNSKPSSHKSDWFGVDTDSNTLYVGFNNGNQHGDIIRVFTETSNTAPVARNDVGVIAEDSTLSVSNGANANVSGSYDATGEHSGDVIDTSSTTHYDTDADSDTLTVTAVRLGSSEGSGTAGSVGSALTGTYGQLTLNSNGSYSYAANQSAADALDAGDTVYDYFNYTVSDGTETDTAVITITVIGINDDVTAVNDYGVVTEDATLTVTNGESQNLSGSYDTHDEHSGDISANDTDPDASPTHTITAIRTGSIEGSGTAGSIGSALTGTYGQLTLAADGSYTYVANQDAADALDVGDTVSDYFNYTVSDGTDTDIAVIRIYVKGANDTPVAQNDEGLIAEGSTLTVSNGDNANESGGSYNATGEHTGDVMDTSSSSHSDSDADASASLSITGIRTGRESAAAASFVDSFSVGSQDILPYDLAFNTDGTKMFVVGNAGQDVNEYTLSTGFDVSTASFVDSFSVGSQDTVPVGLAFNTDGTKMFVVGYYGQDVNEYTLSTGFDVSTASFVDSFSVSSQERYPYGLAFNTDGTKMFVVGYAGDDVNEYTLSTGFDVSTASFVDSFSVGSQDTVPVSLAFNTDGTKMFVVGYAGDDVNEYTLSTGFDVSTASFVDSFSVSSQDTDPVGLAFNTDGTKMFVVGREGNDVNEYTLTSAFRLANDTGSVGSSLTGAYGTLTMSSNGSYTYAANSSIVGLDSGESVYDYFTYTVSDASATDTAELKITIIGAGNTAPVARNDVGVIEEDSTLSVSDGANANETGGSYNATGEHSGDVINTSSTTHYDTDADGDTLTVTAIRLGSSEGSGTAGTVGQALTGTYGQLTLNANGSYSYVANQTAADALDAGDSVTDSFNYTISDGTATDIGTITITVLGINDAPVAQNDVGVIVEGSTLTVANSANANESGGSYNATGEHSGDVIDTSSSSHTDSDADASSSLSITHIKLSGGSNSTVASSSSYNSNGTSITGTYGTITIGADGSYTYAATTDATDALDAGESATDTFVYTLSDGTAITTANLTITVLGANDAPVAQNDVGVIAEDSTLTVSDGADANETGGSYNATGEHSGDVIDSSNTSTRDTDVDVETLTVTAVRLGSSEGSGTAGSVGSALTGTYGQLTLNSNGSYTYVANQTAADALDAGDSVTDSFNYTVSDGTATDTAVITITVLGINDTPTAQNDVGVIVEDGTLTVTNGANATLDGSYDATGENSGDLMDTSSSSHSDSDSDASASLSITQIKKDGGSNSSVASGSSYNSSGTQVTGTYGTLTIGADGSYTYAATQDAADPLDAGDTATDVFAYTLSDGTTTTTANLTITILGANDAPVAQNDTGTVNEDATLTVSNGGNAAIVAGASHDGSPYAIDEGSIRSLTFNNDGTTMFVVHASTPAVISKHALSTAFDITTASQSTTYDISSHTTSPRGLIFNSDGTKLYINSDQSSNKKVYEFSLSTAYDISSLSSPSSTVVSGQDGSPKGIAFNTDGSKMFLIGDSNNTVYEYSLSSAFDTTTISYTSRSLDVSSKEVTPRGLSFNSTGTKLFITGQNSDEIHEYDLSTGFNLSTASYNGAFDMTGTVTKANDIVFNNDGTKAFIGQTGTNKIFSYSLSSPFSLVDITGENTGDVLHTSSSSNLDSDADDSASLTVSAIRTGSSEGSGTSGSIGSALTGTYGQLTIAANGSYSYVANQAAADALDAGDIVTDSFNYTVSDGTATDTAVITITVIGINDTPTAQNDVGVIVEDGTLTVANSADATLTGTYDATGENSGDLIDTSSSSHTDSDSDASASLSITQIKKSGGSNSAVGIGSSYNSSGTQVTGTYGTLTIGADGSYTYAATQDAADVLDVGETATDVFVYTLSDGTATTTANLTITILGANDAPVAANDYGAINEDATLTVSDGDNQTVSGRYDASGEHSGDVINTSYTGTDTDVDGDTLTVSAVRLGSTAGSGTAGTVGSALTGTYGQLTLNANGSYTYVANQTAADALDAGDEAVDYFNYTVSDGAATDIAVISIKVLGINDTPVAQNDVGVIAEDSTLTVINGANANESGGSYNATGEHSGDVINTSSGSHQDSDADASASLTVTQIKKNGGSNSSVSSGSSYNSSGTSVTGTYGTLTIGADGSYTYAATADAADGIASGETANDVFVYTLSDGTETTTANITITIIGANDSPTAQNDVGVIMEGSTLTVANSSNANVSGSFDATGEHSGDVIDTSSSSHTDTDPDTSNTLTITHIKKDGGSNSTVSSSSSYNSSGTAVTGAYGTLTIGADGSYKYVAQSDISGFDAGETLTDTFTYTVSDGTATTTANIVITLLGDDGSSNNAPVAQNDVGVIAEDSTLTVANGANATLSGSYDATGENSGDVMDTSSSGHTDSDADGDAITVTQIRKSGGSDSSVSSSSSYNSSGTSVTGTYGTLVIGADGSYTYAADQSAADDLDAGDSVTDTFIYTISDGTATATATLTITVLGINDAPTAVNDTDSVNEDGTVTKTGAQDDVLTDDSDPDDSATLTVTAIQPSGGSSSNVSSGSTYDSSGTSVTGTYGTLIIGADGSYTYTADQSAADDLDAGDTVDDVFTYTVSDGTTTTTATITITVTGVNDTPVAQNDVGVIAEDSTLTVTNGANANVSGSYDATGEHSGDVMDTSSSSHTDSDADDSASLTITQIKKDGGSNSSVSSGSSYNSSGTSVTGTYGTLTIGADGSYTYVADQAAADALDAGDSANDVFVYTLSDGTATTTANITISVLGINDDPAAVNDTDSVSEDGTVTKTGSQDDVLNDDTDADDAAALTVTAIQPSGGSSSNVSSGSTYASSGTSVTGTYGTLIIGADGSYTYTADQSAADDLDSGDSENDVFTYTVSDGTTTTTATITITVNGINDTPVAQNDVGVIAEDSTLTVANGDNANVSGSYDATGEHSGDVIDTTSSSHTDSDADDSASLTITQIKKDGGSNSSVSSGSSYNSSGTSVTGTYGTLTIGADGSYTYVADQTAADALDAGDSANDVFVYTLSDGTATTTANITISVLGINDDPAAVDDTDTVSEGATVTKTGSQDDVLNDDTDADDSSSLTVTAIQPSGGSSSSVTSSSTYESNGTTVTGTYGTLTIGADGSYTYTANQDAADALDDSESATDVFTYTVSDGTSTDTATITITVNGSNDAPVARNDTGTVEEDATLTVSDGDNASAVSATSFVDGFSVSSQENNPQGFRFNNDGTKMFVIGSAGDDINEYTLSTGFDVSTASFVDSKDISSQETGPRDLAFNSDGTKMFVVGVQGDDVNEYTLSTAFDVSTASFVDSKDISSQDSNPTGLAFNQDGTKMFVAGNAGDDINEYTLSTGFDVSTASFVDSFSVSSQDAQPNGLTFNSDGTKMFVVGNQGNDINEYDLSLGFDVSTASFVGALDVSSQDSAPKAISFNHDGTKLFVLGSTNKSVFEYSLTSPFSLINVDAEHSGDVIDTSNTSSYDTDVDVETLTVTAVRLGSSEGSGTAGTVGSALTGTYGQLTLNANGSYTYVANQSAADDLDAGDIVYDYFNYTVSDGDATDIAVITITVVGINDTPVAVNDTDSVNEDATVTKTGSQDDALYDDTDADDSDSLTVTGIAPSGGSTSTVSEGSTYASGGTTVTGTYGTLIIGADGSYTYTADQSAA
jgi:VCBS repeat-containing protein